MRLFVGIPIDDSLRPRVTALARQFERATGSAARWVPAANLHFTLKFLGHADEARVPEIEAALAEAVAAVPSFAVELAGVGAFPDSQRARVLWIGAASGATELRELAAAVEGRLSPLGFPTEGRAFEPHLTIARLEPPRRLALDSLSAERFGSMGVSSVTLFRSRTLPSGSVYEALARFTLLAPPVRQESES